MQRDRKVSYESGLGFLALRNQPNPTDPPQPIQSFRSAVTTFDPDPPPHTHTRLRCLRILVESMSIGQVLRRCGLPRLSDPPNLIIKRYADTLKSYGITDLKKLAEKSKEVGVEGLRKLGVDGGLGDRR